MFDNTANRIYGEANQQLFNTNNTEYGVAKHTTQGIAQIGRKTARMEREIERQVQAEMQAKRDDLAARDQDRYFDTTNGENHCQMPLD